MGVCVFVCRRSFFSRYLMNQNFDDSILLCRTMCSYSIFKVEMNSNCIVNTCSIVIASGQQNDFRHIFHCLFTVVNSSLSFPFSLSVSFSPLPTHYSISYHLSRYFIHSQSLDCCRFIFFSNFSPHSKIYRMRKTL